MKTCAFISLLTLLFLSGCGQKGEEKWTSYVYPDKQNNKRSLEVGVFNSLQECQDASQKTLTELKLKERGTYQCGLNCGFHEGMKTQICEKMTK